jgi:deazaflavin-dependent oxidoreductase (nitroreductase family)
MPTLRHLLKSDDAPPAGRLGAPGRLRFDQRGCSGRGLARGSSRYAPAVPLKLSRRVARFNRAVNNPIQRQYAWLLPPWVIISHRGRRSGRLYRTPVNAYKRGRTLAVVVLYGEESDWVQNVLAGGGQVIRAGRTYELVNPRLLDPAHADGVSGVARAIGRLSQKLLVAELGARADGFGPGPTD